MISPEEVVIGALLIDRFAVEEHLTHIEEGLFTNESYRIVFQSIKELQNEGLAIDLVTVCEKLNTKGELEKIGGPVFISSLTEKVAGSDNIESHVKILQSRYLEQECKKIGNELLLNEEGFKYDELLAHVESKLSGLNDLIFKDRVRGLDSIVKEMFERMERMQQNENGLSGIDTGFDLLNHITGGWQEPDLIILAARPGMGKTSLALEFAKNPSLSYGIPTAIFSLEMSAVQLTQRIVSMETGIELPKIVKNKMNTDEQIRFTSFSQRLTSAPIYIDDTAGISLNQLRAKVLRLKREKNIRLVVVDYLQLMQSGKKTNGQTEEVTKISQGLKRIAKEAQLPMIVLSQLNRQVETRGGLKRPQLSDLRESGAIEQDADMVLFLYRPEYYDIKEDENGNPTDGLAEVIFAKHRNGGLGTAELTFIGKNTKFENREEGF